MPKSRALFSRLIPAFLAAALLALGAAGCGGARSRSFYACSYSKGAVLKVDAEGDVVRRFGDLPSNQDAWPLANGNLLVSHLRGAREISLPDGKVVWEYRSEEAPVEVHSCQPLPGGAVLICENGPARLIEVNRAGEIVKEIPLHTTVEDVHGQFRMARFTLDGTYLVAFFHEGEARELDAAGDVLRVFSAKDRGHDFVHGAVRLPSGHTLMTTAYTGCVFEFDEEGEIVWSFLREDLPDALKTGDRYARYAGGVQRLANGNTVISYYDSNPQYVEVTPEKEVVWSYWNPDLGNIASQTRIREKGDPAKLEILR